MMYANKMAVALKHKGKVLRDSDSKVILPFGSEYSILVKNLNSVRALVTVTVDGTDAGDGTQFVIDAHDSLDLERFIKNGNLHEGNKFKFIERTENIENHRGIGVEDGLVRVEFQFEKPAPIIRHQYYPTNIEIWHTPPRPYYGSSGDPGPLLKGMRGVGGADVTFTANNSNVELQSMNVSSSVGDSDVQVNYSAEVQANDAGITVPGSVSDQQFTTVSSFPVESETHVIVLQMLGETEDNKKVTKPVTVKAKPECTSCGKKNKATAKFCSDCGTSLTIV